MARRSPDGHRDDGGFYSIINNSNNNNLILIKDYQSKTMIAIIRAGVFSCQGGNINISRFGCKITKIPLDNRLCVVIKLQQHDKKSNVNHPKLR